MERIVVEPAADGNHRDAQRSSLARRLTFAGHSWFFFDRLFCGRALRPFARMGHSQTARIPDHAMRIGFDLLECIRTGTRVPDIGNPELALLDVDGVLPQHPRFRSYWYDAALHSGIGMFLGIDLIRHRGRYHVLELNHGPSIYPRRRAMYDTPYDPIVSALVSAAQAHRFRRVVPIAFDWHPLYIDELERAGREHGLEVVPTNCPIERPGAARMVGLPQPLDPETMYVIHSGLMSPLCRYVDNKWYTSKWLADALAHDLPSTTKLAMPRTADSFFFPDDGHDERWPNLVVKLAGGARSTCVIAGRFDDEADARRHLGINGRNEVPKALRLAFANSLLFHGRERVLYQSFVPPELDERGHAQLVRLHLFVSPLGTTYLSGHLRVSRQPVPPRAPRGIIAGDEVFIFNEAEYRLLPSSMENDLREVAEDLGEATRKAIGRKFETGD